MEPYMLFPTKSAPGEYYVCTSLATKGMAGQLQYKLERGKLSAIVINRDDLDLGTGWSEIRKEDYTTILPSLIPKTITGGKPEQWTIITAWRIVRGTEIWIKAALHKTDAPDLIAVMTTTNNKENIVKNGQRAIQSHIDDWFIGHYRMSSPG